MTRADPSPAGAPATHPVREYYDHLAKDYDRARFGNSYGRYVDDQERRILRSWLARTPPADVVDLGCGTGRLLDFAGTGVDASAEMLKVAAAKFPDRVLLQADLAGDGLPVQRSFAAALCFHVLMHLDERSIERVLRAAARIVSPGGHLIVDLPSRHRREWKRRAPSATGWHGETAATAADVARWAGPHWRIVRRRGILLVPIHRVPQRLRPWLGPLDALLGRTPLGRHSSYHVYQLERLA